MEIKKDCKRDVLDLVFGVFCCQKHKNQFWEYARIYVNGNQD